MVFIRRHRLMRLVSFLLLASVAAPCPAWGAGEEPSTGGARVRLAPVESFEVQLRVSPDGDDANDGASAPFATLTRARDEVRALRAGGVDGAILVRLGEGTWTVRQTLELTAEDSGRPGAPTVWRADRPGTAHLHGGAYLRQIGPLGDEGAGGRIGEEVRGQVRQVDLRAMGIEDFGELRVRGFAQGPPPATVELFFDGRPLTLARWPNEGMVGVERVVEPGSRADGKPSVFVYEGDRPARWVSAPDGWLFGYFLFLWADATLPIGQVDPDARTITTAEPYDYNQRGMETVRQPIRYYAFNLLEELDAPGEWYLDRRSGRLYLIPPDDGPHPEVVLGMLNGPMIHMEGVSDVRLEGLLLDVGRSDGLVARDSSRIVVAGCTVRRFAGTGISMHGGEGNLVLGCDVHTMGRRGIEMIGGERATLTPGGHVVANCRIHDVGRIDRTYTPAIQLEGVGNRVAHNRMHDVPSSAMRIEGNDHVVEFNDFHDLVSESDDQGAIDMWGNPTYRNVVFRYNRFRDVGRRGDMPTVHGAGAIRFDDTISGMTVRGNLFIRSSQGGFGAVQIHAGRDNVIESNVFVDCRYGVSGGWNPRNQWWRAARADTPPGEFITTELYRRRYPQIATMFDEPGVNHVRGNLFIRTQGIHRGQHLEADGNVTGDGSEVREAADGTYRLVADAPAVAELQLPVGQLEHVGLYEDAYRASWPAD